MVAALAVALARLSKRLAIGESVVLATPILATLGQLHFAVTYPFDDAGLVKGAYLQFAAPPLFTLFGVAVAWLWRRPRLRVIAALELLSLSIVGAYSVCAVMQ